MRRQALAASITAANAALYQLTRPMIYAGSAQAAHENVLRVLKRMDGNAWLQRGFRALQAVSFPPEATSRVSVGGVDLPHPLILAAGFVKGRGFNSEAEALAAVRAGENIIPGWRTMPALVGAVEFGSFTRHPRIGNAGTVIWRHTERRTTQNRVGLKNPGAVAAASFLYQHLPDLPSLFGVNIAPTPAVDDPAQIKTDVIDSIRAFIARGVRPAWFTLNLSCPNTEDDPGGHQTTDHARDLCGTVVDFLREYVAGSIPLWVKVSPCLSAAQYHGLMAAFAETGVQAVIATNTLGAPSPDDPTINAGIGGADLHAHALQAVRYLHETRTAHRHPVDIIACGGVQDPISYHAFKSAGADAAQYWSALVFKGPLAAARILQEDITP